MLPTLWLDPRRATAAYDELLRAAPALRVRYAVKANPHPALLAALAGAGAHFTVVSLPELTALLAVGVPGSHIACLTPGPPATLLRACRAAGVAHYAVDSPWELRKLAALVPGAAAVVTLALPPAGRLSYPTARVGVAPEALDALLAAARGLPLDLCGVAFHVGSQCERLAAWTAGLQIAAAAWERVAAAGWQPRVLNVGGALPMAIHGAAVSPRAVAGRVQAALPAFVPAPAEVWWEPGRYLAAPAGVLETRALRAGDERGRPWVQVGVGRYHGLPEAALGIRYHWRTERCGAQRTVRLVGPLGADADLLDRVARLAPVVPGDRLWIWPAGAYTACQTAYPSASGLAVRVASPLPRIG